MLFARNVPPSISFDPPTADRAPAPTPAPTPAPCAGVDTKDCDPSACTLEYASKASSHTARVRVSITTEHGKVEETVSLPSTLDARIGFGRDAQVCSYLLNTAYAADVAFFIACASLDPLSYRISSTTAGFFVNKTYYCNKDIPLRDITLQLPGGCVISFAPVEIT